MEESQLISILYVDDEQINLNIFEFNFRKKYKVYTANSGNIGLEILEHCPDIKVVISDMKMPGMNGLEFIKIAKSKYQNIVFFILTGYDITADISNAINENLIHKYFSKPLDIAKLDFAISEAAL